MAEKRKLLAEIEKCFKKIDEGVELFEETMGKMSESNSDNQREKLQDDLKKEIKKLQRLRDQVKNWQNSSEIKDKEKLTSYRRLIETKMEQFKDVERDHKTKPHSKQGLCAEEKLDPKDRARIDCSDWLNSTIRSLNGENDKLEASLEQLSSGDNGRRRGKGKEDPKKAEKEKELRLMMEGIKFHIDKLEMVMRLVDNESLDPKDVEEALKDEMEQLFSEMENEGTLYSCEIAYDELDLESFAAILGKNPSVDDEKHDEHHANGHTSPEHPQSIRHSSSEVPPSPALVKRASSTTSSHHASLKIAEASPSSVDGISCSSISASIASPTAPTPPPPPVIPYNSIAAGAVRSVNSTPASTGAKSAVSASPSVGSASLIAPLSPSTASFCSPSSAALGGPSTPSSISSLAQPLHQHQPPLSSSSSTTTAASASATPLQHQQHQLSAAASATSAAAAAAASPAPSTPSSRTKDEKSHSAEGASDTGVEMTKNAVEESRNLNEMPSISDELRTVLRMNQGEPKSLEPQTAHIPPYLGASPLGRAPPHEDHDKHLGALDAALQRLPQQMDSERPRSYLPKMPCTTPTFYPQQAPSNSDTMEYYLRLSPETLFFTFYYMEGSRAQLIAAKALKKLSWRFHTKYLMWFQRHEEPKQITDDFEEGTYIYFDYEKWSQRKKEQFRFEYRYLEDRELE